MPVPHRLMALRRPPRHWPTARRFYNAPVAQPDRVVASEAIGRGFESLRARHFSFIACTQRPNRAMLRSRKESGSPPGMSGNERCRAMFATGSVLYHDGVIRARAGCAGQEQAITIEQNALLFILPDRHPSLPV